MKEFLAPGDAAAREQSGRNNHSLCAVCCGPWGKGARPTVGVGDACGKAGDGFGGDTELAVLVDMRGDDAQLFGPTRLYAAAAKGRVSKPPPSTTIASAGWMTSCATQALAADSRSGARANHAASSARTGACCATIWMRMATIKF